MTVAQAVIRVFGCKFLPTKGLSSAAIATANTSSKGSKTKSEANSHASPLVSPSLAWQKEAHRI